MRKKPKTLIQKFLAFSDAEKQAQVAPFEKEHPGPGKPLTPAQRKLWARVKRDARRQGRLAGQR
jgi:hypothetical protein